MRLTDAASGFATTYSITVLEYRYDNLLLTLISQSTEFNYPFVACNTILSAGCSFFTEVWESANPGARISTK